MKKNYSDISEYVKVNYLANNKRIVVFLICLFFATSLWLLNALSKDYSTTISYPVKFINPPANRFLAEKPLAKLNMEVDGRGFTLLRFKLFSFSPVSLNIEEITKNLESNSGTYKVTSRNLISEITDQLDNEIRITNIKPEVFVIVMDSLSSKTVPVELEINVEFEPQFNLKTPISTIPKNVEITGPTIVLDRISLIKTKVNIIDKLNSSISQNIDLIHPDKTSISPENVTLVIDVEKYTEKELKIPIEILNKPEMANIKLFPSELKVLFSVGLSRFESIQASDFSASVDYNSIVNDVNNLAITVHNKPDFIQGIRFIPEKVEFLIETN